METADPGCIRGVRTAAPPVDQMKSLLFLRHAEASHEDEASRDDHERALTPDGERASRAIGAFLARAGLQPDLVFTSTAARAQQTLACAREAGHFSAPVHASRDFYGTKPRRLLDEIQYAPDAAERLLLVGHEPAWSRTVCRLTGGSEILFPPAAIARVDADVTAWADVRFGHARLVWLLPPDVLERLSDA